MKKVKVGKSKIHGNGLFADEPIKRGDVIQLVHTMRELEPGVMKTTPTLLGRNYNHSEDSNALNVVDGNNRYLVALKEIEAGGEITTDYRTNPELEQPGAFTSNDNYISFDYDDTLTTPEGFKLAQQMNKEGKNLYVITARDKVTPQMIERAEAAGIPKENIIAAGSDEAKVRIIKENNINKHIDNKESVIKALGDTGELFAPDAYPDLKADFVEMDLSDDDLNKLKEGGFIIDQYPDGGESKNNRKFKERLMKRYPGMQGVYGAEGENLNIVKDPNYDARSAGYGDIEFTFPGDDPVLNYPNLVEEGGPDYNYPNPSPDKYTALYNPRGANRGDIFLDMMHGMRDDPNYQPLLQNFEKAVRDARGEDMDWYYDQQVKKGSTQSKERYDENYVDSQLRAELAPGSIGMFSKGRRDYRKERKYDSPEMRTAAKDVRNYLKGEYQDGGEQKIPWNPDYPASTTYEFQPLSPEQIAQRNFEQEKERAIREQERLMQEQENWTPAQWAQYRKQEDLKKYQQALIDEPKYFDEGRQFVSDWHNSPMYNKMVLNSYMGNAKDAAYITKLRQQNIASMPKLNIVNSRTTKYNSEAPAAWADHTQVEVFPGGFGTGPSLYVHEGLHVSDTPKLNFQPKSYSDPRFPKDDAVWLGRLMPASDQMYMLKNRAANYKDNSAYDEMLADSGYKIPTDEEIKQEVISEGISSDNPNFDEYFNKVKNQYVNSFKVFDQQHKRNWQEHSHNYVSNPTEVRARLGEIRYNAKNAGIYDPFTEELTPEKFQEYINKKENRGGAFGDLREQYTDEEILWMLNNISKNEDTNQKLDVAKKGGEPKKKKRKTDDYGRYRSEDGNVRTPLTPEMQAVMPPDEWGQYIQEFPEVYTTRTREQQDIRNALDYQQRMAELYPGRPTQSDAIQPADWFWQLGLGAKPAFEGLNALAAAKIPYTGISLGTAANVVGGIHGATQVPQRIEDWQEVVAGNKNWKEAAAETAMTALELGAGAYEGVNALRFKPDPSMYYRGIGPEGYEDAINTGLFRQAGVDGRPRHNKVWWASNEQGFNRAKDFSPTYIAEVPRSSFPETGDEFFGLKIPARGTKRHIPIEEGRILKKDWLRGYKEVPIELPGSSNGTFAYKNVTPSRVRSTNTGLTNENIDKEVANNIKWITSKEYARRRAANTGESLQEIQKSVDKIIKDADKAKFNLNTNPKYMDLYDAEGMMSKKKWFRPAKVEVAADAKHPVKTLKHEIKHLYSPAIFDNRKVYKNYPAITAEDHYLTLGTEQQVRHLNAREQILAENNLPIDAQLSEEQVREFVDRWGSKMNKMDKTKDFSSAEDFDDLWSEQAGSIQKEMLKARYNTDDLNFIKTLPTSQKVRFMSEYRDRLTRSITDALNKAWITVPIAGGAALNSLETSEQRYGGSISKLNKFIR